MYGMMKYDPQCPQAYSCYTSISLHTDCKLQLFFFKLFQLRLKLYKFGTEACQIDHLVMTEGVKCVRMFGVALTSS